MNIIKLITISTASLVIVSAVQSKDSKMDIFIGKLMSQMSIEEKIGQLNLLPAPTEIVTGTKQTDDFISKICRGEVGGVLNCKGVETVLKLQRLNMANNRLRIPMIVGMDVIHGFETIFPIPLAQACSWDTVAIKACARIAAIEATADGQMWTYSPMVDICRDPRWGRMAEGSGEDPFLCSAIAKAMVEGYQGNNLADSTAMMSCVKHFALYGASEAGRDYNTVDMSRVNMYNYFLPPYKAAVESGVGSVMSSFNVVDGVPATANKWLLTSLLRNEWKFSGFVVTDYASISEMTAHGIGDLKNSGALALKAGTDFDMGAESFIRHLREALDEGLVTVEDIDKACRRMLEAKWKLGLFEDPYRHCNLARFKKDVYNEKHLAAARDMAAKTFVLLKNDNVLPLKKKGVIALVGPMADARTHMAGMWSVVAVHERHETLKESMKKALAGTGAKLLYAKGCNFVHDSVQEAIICRNGHSVRDDRSKEEMFREAIDVASKADVIVFAGGEASESSGEGSSRSNLETYDAQRDLLVELKKLGKPIVMLNFSGRSTILNWEDANIDAILNVWFGGSKAGDAICDVLFGDKSPSGHLVTTFPKSVGQIPLYYNHLNTGRPVTGKWFQPYTSSYMDIDNEPLYPFGYGLSYTTFEYGDIVLDTNEMTVTGKIKASIRVTNTGGYDSAEVVQLYIRDVFASISRPVKELKGFKRIYLRKGENQIVEFEITTDLLRFYNTDFEYVCEPGDFELMIGSDSRNTKSAFITLK